MSEKAKDAIHTLAELSSDLNSLYNTFSAISNALEKDVDVLPLALFCPCKMLDELAQSFDAQVNILFDEMKKGACANG